MAVVIQFTSRQPKWRSSQEEEALAAFMTIRDPGIRSGLCDLIKAIAREQAKERSC